MAWDAAFETGKRLRDMVTKEEIHALIKGRVGAEDGPDYAAMAGSLERVARELMIQSEKTKDKDLAVRAAYLFDIVDKIRAGLGPQD
jgi:hypothetical protein